MQHVAGQNKSQADGTVRAHLGEHARTYRAARMRVRAGGMGEGRLRCGRSRAFAAVVEFDLARSWHMAGRKNEERQERQQWWQ